MPFGLAISILVHAALLSWAFFTMRAIDELPVDDTPTISAEIITPSEFLRLKQGAEDAKKLETKAKDEPKPEESKNDTKRPSDAPPPPPPEEVAKLEEPPAPEPPKAEPEPPKPPEAAKPEPDPIAKKIDETPPPPPEPAPGPTPDEQKLLQQKLEEDRKKAEEEAKKKAEEEAKKKAEEQKKLAEEARKKRIAEAKRRAEAAKKKQFDPNALAKLIEKAPDDAAKQKALLDKDPRKKGQQASGTSQTAELTGKEAGTAAGHDVMLSAREQDLLAGMIKSQLARCSKMPGGGGGIDTPVVTVQWKLRQDGSLDGEPKVLNPQNTPLFHIAADASVNAVRNCSPLSLPADKYAAWSTITTDFDWPHILGLR